MESRVYYGEYSLEHWINLMLTKNIGLPHYQRSFVWEERDITRLLESFDSGQFIQPVTIALNKAAHENFYGDAGASEHYDNLIIDGQQRLTAVLLSALGVMPISPPNEGEFAGEWEESIDEGNRTGLKWTFSELLKNSKYPISVGALKEQLKNNPNYRSIKFAVKDDFFKKRYLGFSYIVPCEENSPNDIQMGYTKLFRSINYYGRGLSDEESRRSLYYVNEELQPFFEGLDDAGNDVLCGIKINYKLRSMRPDFVRFISILSEYISLGGGSSDYGKQEIMKRYSSYDKREIYYSDYVSYILRLDQEDNIEKFDNFDRESILKESIWRNRYKALRISISELKQYMEFKKVDEFPSWIDADFWIFGLIYHVVFMGKKLKDDSTGLKRRIDSEIRKARARKIYAKAPNRLEYLRERIAKSITIYAKYVQ